MWWAVIIGLGFGLLPRGRIGGLALAAGGALAGITALMALSLAWASDDGRAFVEVVRAATYLGLFVLFVIAAPRASAGTWLRGLALGLAGVAALALGSRLEPSLFPEPRFVTVLPQVATRLGYPLGYWNAVAHAMAVAVVLLVWLGADAEGRLARSAAIGFLPVPLVVMYMTLSRGGPVALVAGVTALIALGPRRPQLLGGATLGALGGALLIGIASTMNELVDGPLDSGEAASQGHELLVITVVLVLLLGAVRWALDRPLAGARVGRRTARAALAIGAVLVVLGVALSNPADTIDGLTAVPPYEQGIVNDDPASARITSDVGTGRWQYWGAALDAFGEHPVGGLGAGGFESWWAQEGSIRQFVRDAHSLYLESLAELGMAGLLLVLAFFVLPVVAGWRRRREQALAPAVGAALAVLACGAVSASVDWTWELPSTFIPVILAVALLTGPAAAGYLPGRNRYALGVATLVVAWAAVVASGISLFTEVKLGDSRQAVRNGDLDAALEHAGGASTVQPWAAAPYLQLGLVQERIGDLDSARDSLGEAIERSPEDWRPWFILSRVRGAAGDAAGAAEAYDRARQLNPRSPMFAGGP